MCLAVPGQLVSWVERDPTFAKAIVEFDGIRRVCHMACVTEAALGDYVLVHAGIAISRIDATEAQRLLDELRSLELTDELAEWSKSAEQPPRPVSR
jgi:hydrogenase expression/formation protein HypC